MVHELFGDSALELDVPFDVADGFITSYVVENGVPMFLGIGKKNSISEHREKYLISTQRLKIPDVNYESSLEFFLKLLELNDEVSPLSPTWDSAAFVKLFLNSGAAGLYKIHRAEISETDIRFITIIASSRESDAPPEIGILRVSVQIVRLEDFKNFLK